MTALDFPGVPGPAGSAGPAPARRLSPVTGLRNTFTLTWRSLLKLKTNYEEILSLSLTPIMYLLLFTYVFGGAVSGNVHNYLQYVLPGILVISVVFSTLGTGMALSQDMATGVFDRFRSLPISRTAPLAGAVLGDVARYAISVAISLLFGMLLGFRIQTSPLAAVAGCLLVLVFAMAMCWFSALLGLLVKQARSVQWMGSLIYFPLTFGSNVLVKTSTLPGWMQAFVKGNPLTFLTEAERGLLVGGPVATPVIRSLLWALGLFVVFAPLAVRAYRRKT
ncbi:MAG: ABC transporter permease [Nocardiopsaceae bacterium]|nr:ABC transporter permease [Nocardiopsaceae bacterium]